MCADLSRTQRNLLVCERSSFLDEKNRVSSQVEQLRFNYKVSVLLPECGSAPSHLESILNSFSSFYLIKKLPLYELLDKDFLQSAVYQGSVYGLSFRTRIDEDNCVALMPNGHLVFSLDKDTFETLGLEGRPSRSNRTSSRYEVTVDLRDGSMAPGGRGYLRLLQALTSRLKLQMDFLISHHPGGGASLQPLLSRCDWSEHRPDVGRRALSRLVHPSLRSCDPHDLLEWIGAVDASVSRGDRQPGSERVGLRPAAAAGPAAPSGGAEVSPAAGPDKLLGFCDGSRLHRQSGVLGRRRARRPDRRSRPLQPADVP
ncbi:ribonuclease P protein subunit p40 isoform X4 [Xiphophorus couchianus]|uniref:ribonuclease P protein subunit p40 isoform X4 n=1 Tax=Xiphophorus couchianus TaxID=32473 RepID=UPI001017081A|nr:ribonuclease P protein subunit p40 isoform X4 [Xiphophorus couchianus]